MWTRSLWSLLLVCAALRLVGQDPLSRRLTMRNGLPSNMVYTIVQDRDGFIWLGTDAGAVRFDGTHMVRYDVSIGLSDNEVFQVATDSRERVWFLTGNGRPCYVDRKGLHNWRTDSTLARIQLRSGIRSMHEDRKGTLWFGGLKGELATLSAKGTVSTRELADPRTGIVGGHITIGSDPDGRVRVFTNTLVQRLANDVTAMPQDSIEQPSITQSFPNDRVLSTTKRRVLEWHNNAWVTLLDRSELSDAGDFRHAYPLGPDELWVTLWNGGVLWLRREQGKWHAVRDILFRSDLINNVLRDREGNIWLCTAYDGAIMFTESAARTAYYHGQRGGREEFMRAHAGGAEAGGVWCGTNQGDLYRLGDGLELVDLQPAGEVFSRVTSIRTFGRNVWAATDVHLFRVEPEGAAWHSIELLSLGSYPNTAATSSGMKALTIGTEGRLIGTMYGAFELNTGDGRMHRFPNTTIPDVRIYAPHLDARGTLWYEDLGQLFSYTTAGVQRHPEVVLDPGMRITDITSFGDTLFIATDGEGVLVRAGGRALRWITDADGLSSKHVHHLFAQGGELFVATERGADRVSGPWHTPQVHGYAMAIGALPQNVRDVVADSTHAYVLFADGLCSLPRAEDGRSLPMPVPYIRSVTVNDSAAHVSSVIGIRQGKDRLSVEMGAVHFAMADRVRLEYRLDPSAPWQHTLGGTLELTALDAGNHVLQVRAALPDGAWSKAAELRVVVVPPLWSRWWARTLMALALAAGLYVLLRAAAYGRYRRKEQRMQQREAVAQERHRIAMDLHDDLGAELSSLLLLTRLERERPGHGGMERIEQLAGTLTDKVKEVIWNTDPGHDTLEATLSFIQRHLSTVCGRHGLAARTVFAPGLPPLTLSAGLRRELYLIAKEAVNNAVKHSGATTFTFGARLQAGQLELTFSDDGHGGAIRDAEGVGHGLRNIAGRAATVGAVVGVADVRPHGTRITLRIAV
ncbi:MAG: hypothetical protein IPN85_06530 [Flavobacteriales bacterium]|nr:hypothetical protein [Flavobacteriales bacterium]MBK9289224.1 hypothetical protein [Flavobacteriales bacterium]MBL0036723.1 hypothetical protein [Flavobacteriales bacterium]